MGSEDVSTLQKLCDSRSSELQSQITLIHEKTNSLLLCEVYCHWLSRATHKTDEEQDYRLINAYMFRDNKPEFDYFLYLI